MTRPAVQIVGMRSPVLALLALLAFALAACEAEPAGDEDGVSMRPAPYDELADNVCGDLAWCQVDECAPLWSPEIAVNLGNCGSGIEQCTPEAIAYRDCISACETDFCPADDPACDEVRNFAGGIHERCGLGSQSGADPAECDDALAWCDDVEDPA